MKPSHFFTTIQSIDELYRFQNIQQFVEINYLSSSISNLYFGNFFESLQLQEHQAIVKVHNVYEVLIMESPSHILSYRMKITEEPDSYYTFAYDTIPKNRLLSILTTDIDERTLILYHKFVDNVEK
jgi:hypothetical protein